jgi:hypothetical protein
MGGPFWQVMLVVVQHVEKKLINCSQTSDCSPASSRLTVEIRRILHTSTAVI